jgi:ubiquinone/menaquinone biosynthesis C-methylase UbiE
MNAKDYFDNAAETWDTNFRNPRLLSFLEKLVPQFNLKAGQQVLDVGTGTGVLIPYLTEAVGPFGSITAIDFSKKMVNKCKIKHSHIKNLNVTVAKIEEAAFSAESFDAIICFGVFPHFENKKRALQNINRILKPNCKIVIAHALGSEELKNHHKKTSEHVANATMPKKNEIVRLIMQTGFVEVNIRDEPGCYLCIARKPANFERTR